MGSKLYVGGLPYAATESQLTTLFAAHGTVESARVITDKFTGQSTRLRLRRDGHTGRSQSCDYRIERLTNGRTPADGQ